MTDSYAAAQAIMQAFTNGNPALVNDPVYRQACANALHELADHIAPASKARKLFGFKQRALRRKIIAICYELQWSSQ